MRKKRRKKKRRRRSFIISIYLSQNAFTKYILYLIKFITTIQGNINVSFLKKPLKYRYNLSCTAKIEVLGLGLSPTNNVYNFLNHNIKKNIKM